MPDSTARRERLASPAALALLAAAFALAFAVLRPEPGPAPVGGAEPDELELAYLHARAASGERVDEEVRRVARRLLAAGRASEVRALKARFPTVGLAPRTDFALELEGAAGALAAGTGAPHSGGAPDPALTAALATRLERLRDDTALHESALLARGAWLSRRLQRPALTASLHARLAEADPTRAADAWAECGRYASAAGARALAVSCYRAAIDALVTSGAGAGALIDADALADAAFDLRLALLGQLSGADDAVAREATLDALLGRESEDPDRLEALARTLLAIERPGGAAAAFARLAEVDVDRPARWWGEAARWSEAAGELARAAGYADRQAEAVPPGERAAIDARVEALLIAAGRERDALARVRARIERAPDDLAALRRGIGLARGAGEAKQAADWNEALLERAPEDREALVRAIELALGRGDLPTAKAAAERATFRLPDEREPRARLAQIAEWTGAPAVAAGHWRILAATDTGDGARGTSLRELARLAELTFRHGVAADAARELARLSPPSAADLERMVRLYEADGRPDLAAAALEEVLARHGPDAGTLAALAGLHERHGDGEAALFAWERHVALAGPTPDAILASAALHWRANRPARAGELVQGLRGRPLPELDDARVRLLLEIAWRDRRTWLARTLVPHVAGLDDPDQRVRFGRRLVRSLRDADEHRAALVAADALFAATREPDFAIAAIELAAASGDAIEGARYLAAQSLAAGLDDSPAWWSATAALRLRENDAVAARRAWERALELDPGDVRALAALGWLHIEAGDVDALAALLDVNAERAAAEPELWSVYAVGRLGLGDAAGALTWFERLAPRIGADYALLLSYADALDIVGRVDDAARLRRHAFGKLRPALHDALAGRTPERALLREYTALAARYGALEPRAIGALLRRDDESREAWREEIAIAWLLSNERHEHARLVMARLHGARGTEPAWQALSVALAANDLEAVADIVARGDALGGADRIVALTAIGDERAALELAAREMRTSADPATRAVAAERYARLRALRPSWAEVHTRRGALGSLGIDESGVALRHTFARADLGLSLAATRRVASSDALQIDGDRVRERLGLSLHAGDARRGARLDASVESDADDALPGYGARAWIGDAAGRRELSAELAVAEPVDDSAELLLGAKRDRASLAFETAFGTREFLRLGVDATDLRTRRGDASIARGTAGSVAVGTRGALAGAAWSTSVRASHAANDRASELPAALGATSARSFDEILAPRRTTLGLDASVAWGGAVGELPRGSRPRLYAGASVAHDWPQRDFGLRLDTGLGLRVLGGDELSFTLGHDTRDAARSGGGTALRLGYRYHY